MSQLAHCFPNVCRHVFGWPASLASSSCKLIFSHLVLCEYRVNDPRLRPQPYNHLHEKFLNCVSIITLLCTKHGNLFSSLFENIRNNPSHLLLKCQTYGITYKFSSLLPSIDTNTSNHNGQIIIRNKWEGRITKNFTNYLAAAKQFFITYPWNRSYALIIINLKLFLVPLTIDMTNVVDMQCSRVPFEMCLSENRKPRSHIHGV